VTEWLDAELLPQMAAQGTALTPMITVWMQLLDAIREEAEASRRCCFKESNAYRGWRQGRSPRRA
jgi:hypothetical protein